MGKAAKLKQARREAAPDPHLPVSAVPVPPGRVIDRETMTVALPRPAAFWHTLGGRTLQCDLCYRACVLKPGETGWCGYRRNVAGAVDLPDHGVLARCQPFSLGYMGGIHTFLPGARALGIGGTKCTARCAFCTSADVVWQPERIPWARDVPHGLGGDGSWYYKAKAVLHPEGVIANAAKHSARAIVFSENEPLLSWEYTYDVARLAKAAGLYVVVYTNGFSTPEAIAALAPFVDAVDLGIKGSLDPTFYERKMRAPGAPDAVRASLLAWREAGVYLLISDLIATEYQQDDTTHEAASAALYAWIVANMGAHTPVMLGHMHPPDGQRTDARYLLPRSLLALSRYRMRIADASSRARAAGLAYVHESSSQEAINCHNCGGLLLERHAPATPDGALCPRGDDCAMFQGGCSCWSHTQHVTASRCDHCGATVPIVTLPREEATVRGFSGVRLLVIDEASRVAEALYQAVRPMLAVSGGRIVLLSTPFGKRGFFHHEWTEGGADWERIQITAYDCPRIDRAWLDEERRRMGEWWFRQEFLCEFVDTIDQVFAYADVMGAVSADVAPLFAVEGSR